MSCQIIQFPESDTEPSLEYDPYQNTLLSEEDILNLLVGVINLIKRYATVTQLEFLLDRLEDVREDLLQGFI
ncbi:MAG: hypothetical protein FWE01_00390 [Firmicutes bacterium]|nr:hypothetical protein [Bacillota bacterium]